MVSIDLFTDKKMYDGSCIRFNEHYKVTLRRYVDGKIDYYSRAEKMAQYTYQYPAIGTSIIRDQIVPEKDKIRYIIEFIGGSPKRQSRSAIALLIGDADRGKTAFMYWLMEQLHEYMEKGIIAKRPIVCVRDDVPPEAPDYIHFVMTYSDAPPQCMVLNTKIQTSFGIKKLSDMVTGDLVKSYNFNTNIFEYKPCIVSDIRKKSSVIFEMEDGSKIECSPEHRLFTGRELLKASDIRDDDKVFKP